MNLMWVSVIAGVIGFAAVAYFARYVLAQDQGPESVRETSAAIKEGAMAFLNREYRTLAIVVAIITVILAVVPALGWKVAAAFVFGAACSMAAGYAGMNMAIRANGRTCAAARAAWTRDCASHSVVVR